MHQQAKLSTTGPPWNAKCPEGQDGDLAANCAAQGPVQVCSVPATGHCQKKVR